MKTKIDPIEEARKARIIRIKTRASRKQARIQRCSQQAIAAKARLIDLGYGANGRSMNSGLLSIHAKQLTKS